MPTPTRDFFAFDPKLPRLALWGGAVIGGFLSARTLAEPHHSSLRVLLPGLLLLGQAVVCSTLAARLQARPRFGVALGPDGVSVSRLFWGPPTKLAWWELAGVTREGKERSQLHLWRSPSGKVVLKRTWFESAQDFEALSAALLERKPPPILDA